MNKPLVVSLSLGITALPFLLKVLLKEYFKKQQQKLERELEYRSEKCYFDCIFIDYKNFKCRDHLFSYRQCGDGCSYFYLQRLIKFIGSAQKTINMCMYMMTSKQISEEMANASRRGVKVQVITDQYMAQTVPYKKNLARETKAGVKSKTQTQSDTMMHHKFCLVDEKDPQLAKMFFGSLNLTTQAICRNFEAVVFTNDQDIIRRFSKEFEELWEEFE